ncbi:MAG: tetratricopeptide repeat protein [Microcoleaceae cyanobacterium]
MSHHFFMWTVRRTGGSSLKRSLEHISDHPVIQAEAFNADRILGYDNEEEKLLQRFEKIRGKHYCIKHCWELHKPKFNNMILNFAKQEGYRFILLTRENVLEMLISLELAYQTKVWGRGQIGNISNYEKREFSPLNLQRMRKNCDKYEASLVKNRELLVQKQLKWMEISHEQLYKGSEESRFSHFNRMCQFLDISQSKIDENHDVLYNELVNQKQNSSKVYSQIPNILRVQQEFPNYKISFEEVDPNLVQGVHQNQESIQNLIERADELKKQGNLKEAVALYQTILAEDPKSIPALRELGSLYERQGKVDEAIKLYQQAITCDPSRAGLYVKLANALSKQAKFEEAVACYEKATQLKDNLHPQVHLDFKRALEMLNKSR